MDIVVGYLSHSNHMPVDFHLQKYLVLVRGDYFLEMQLVGAPWVQWKDSSAAP